jgi:hypothetical protein
MRTAYVTSTSSFAGKASSDHLSPDLVAVIVFSFIGLAASALLIGYLDSDAFSFFLGAF